MSKSKATEWIGIISVLHDSGLLSMSTTMNAFDDVAQKYKIGGAALTKLINETHTKIDFEASDAQVFIEWLDKEIV